MALIHSPLSCLSNWLTVLGHVALHRPGAYPPLDARYILLWARFHIHIDSRAVINEHTGSSLKTAQRLLNHSSSPSDSRETRFTANGAGRSSRQLRSIVKWIQARTQVWSMWMSCRRGMRIRWRHSSWYVFHCPACSGISTDSLFSERDSEVFVLAVLGWQGYSIVGWVLFYYY